VICDDAAPFSRKHAAKVADPGERNSSERREHYEIPSIGPLKEEQGTEIRLLKRYVTKGEVKMGGGAEIVVQNLQVTAMLMKRSCSHIGTERRSGDRVT